MMWSAIGLSTARRLCVSGARGVHNLGRIASRASRIPQQHHVSTSPRSFVVSRGLATTRGSSTTKTKPKKAAKKSTTGGKTKKRSAGKKAAAAKPKKRARKPVSPEQAQKAHIKSYKDVALLNGEPAKLPESKWLVYTTQQLKGTKAAFSSMASLIKETAESYKALPSFELEALERTAEQNKLANQAAYKSWVEGHTPTQIAEANKARKYLRRVTKLSSAKSLIRDERLPKRGLNAYLLFVKSRWQSGDVSGAVAGSSKNLSAEWKALSESERQPFVERAKQDQERYDREVKTVLGK